MGTSTTTLKVGDRVYYNDGGPTDTGMVTEVSYTGSDPAEHTIVVEFDDGVENGAYWPTQFTLVA